MHRAIFQGGPFDGYTETPTHYYESALIKSDTSAARYNLIHLTTTNCHHSPSRNIITGLYKFIPPNPKKPIGPADTILNMPKENIHHTAAILKENQTLADVLTTLGVVFEPRDLESIKNAVIIDQGKGGKLL